MNFVKIIIISIFLLFCANSIKSQSFFKGSIVAGINLSQIDGDKLAGYRKFGVSAGFKIEFPLNSILDFGIEFLFNQSGSRSSIIKGNFGDLQRIHLNYASLPLIIKWNDWWIEESNYYKFNLHTGLVPSRLISARSNLGPNAISGEFSNYDFSFLLGGGYAYNENWALSLRFTRSINTLYKQELSSGEESALIGYFITIRSEYTF